MNRLKKIFEALAFLHRNPAAAIAAKWTLVRAAALPDRDSAGVPDDGDPLDALPDGPFKEAVNLVDKVVAAVVGIAEDAAKKGGDA